MIQVLNKSIEIVKLRTTHSLELNNLGIERIENADFENIDSSLLVIVETLDLSSNKISFIGEKVFSYFPNLKSLLLFNNQLNENVFDALNSASQTLVTLKLYGNKIKDFNGLNLKKIDQLKVLKLDYAQSSRLHLFFRYKLPGTFKVVFVT